MRFITPGGVLLDGDTALHMVIDLWCRTRSRRRGRDRGAADRLDGRRIASPRVTGARSFGPGVLAVRWRRRCSTGGRSSRAAPLGGYIFGDFFPAFDGVLTVGMVSRMLDRVGESMDQVVAGLPEFHKSHATVFCPTDRKGAVMRAVTEAAVGLRVDLTEGVRVIDDDGWALVLPDSTEPIVNVWGEGPSLRSGPARESPSGSVSSRVPSLITRCGARLALGSRRPR